MASGYYVGQKILNDCRSYGRGEERQGSGYISELKFTSCYVEEGCDSTFIKCETVNVDTI